jgi:hypothetical protein
LFKRQVDHKVQLRFSTSMIRKCVFALGFPLIAWLTIGVTG